MREFLEQTLDNLYNETGVDQLKHLSKDESEDLIKSLLSVCNTSGLSNVRMQKIIQQRLLKTRQETKNFTGLNKSVLFTWFYEDKVANPYIKTTSAGDNEYWEIQRRNEAFYKNQLAEIRKENPGYDPEKEFSNRLRNWTAVKSQKKHRPTRGNAEDTDYEEIKD